jgi:hypothetical protein
MWRSHTFGERALLLVNSERGSGPVPDVVCVTFVVPIPQRLRTSERRLEHGVCAMDALCLHDAVRQHHWVVAILIIAVGLVVAPTVVMATGMAVIIMVTVSTVVVHMLLQMESVALVHIVRLELSFRAKGYVVVVVMAHSFLFMLVL